GAAAHPAQNDRMLDPEEVADWRVDHGLPILQRLPRREVLLISSHTMLHRIGLGLSLLAILLTSCAPGGGQAGPPSAVHEKAAQAKKRITVALRSNITLLWGGVGAGPEWQIDLFNSPLIAFDPPGTPTPLLAEAAPSIENGLWKLLPDGRMETTTVIRQGARWHDGTPVTAEDAVFG